jgi:hypothetical protein
MTADPAAHDRSRQTIDLRDVQIDRLAELVAHLTEREPDGVRGLVTGDYRAHLSADEALRLTAHAMVELRGTTTASVRVAPYLGRLRLRHEDRPGGSEPLVSNDRFDLRVHDVAHRPLHRRNRPTGTPGPGRSVTG